MKIEFTHDEIEIIFDALSEYENMNENEDDLILISQIQSKMYNANLESVK